MQHADIANTALLCTTTHWAGNEEPKHVMVKTLSELILALTKLFFGAPNASTEL